MQRREFIKTGAFTSAVIAMPDISGFALDKKRVKKGSEHRYSGGCRFLL